MKKRILSLLLALTLAVTMASPVSAAAGYSDVPRTHWAAGSVARATELGLFNGVGGGRFGLGQPITRAAFVTALVRLFSWEEVSPSEASFSDVRPGDWFYTAVETAAANGAIAATGSTFRPGENITRQEMASMIVRGLGYASLAGRISTYGSPFTDVKVNKGFITIAYDLGIVSGIGDGKFAPNSTATREQAAAMLARVYDKLYSLSLPLSSAEGYTLLRIDTPEATEGAELPTTPLEPIADLYGSLQKLKNSGTDMSKVALCLTGGGVRTLTNNGKIIDSDTLTADEVAELLASTPVRTYYSDRYESAYCIFSPNSYQNVTIWYQSDESMAAKLQLAKLFGVTWYIVS